MSSKFSYDAGLDNYKVMQNTNGLMKGSTITPDQYNRIQTANGAGAMGLSGLKTGLAGIQVATGLYNALQIAPKQLKLAEKGLGLKIAAANRDVANQAKMINADKDNATNVGLALAGSSLTGAQKEAARANTRSTHVDGSRIG